MKYALFGEALVFPLSGASPNRTNTNLNLVCIHAGRERGDRAPFDSRGSPRLPLLAYWRYLVNAYLIHA